MERWSSHFGFILAAIGAAVGIGNIWRFSAVLGQNGGGAYLIPYFIAVMVFALPLMILEITMGRRYRGTVVSSFPGSTSGISHHRVDDMCDCFFDSQLLPCNHRMDDCIHPLFCNRGYGYVFRLYRLYLPVFLQ